MRQRRPVEYLVSAGGVVHRAGESSGEVVLCGRSQPPIWSLPKGTPELGETRVQTAIREVVEETGLKVKIECFIDSIEYWFVRPTDGVRCHKSVLFYLMSATGGDTSRHDHEFDDVRWFPVPEALMTLTYGDETKVVKKGLSMASE